MQRDIIRDVQWQAVLVPERPSSNKENWGHVIGHPGGAGCTPLYTIQYSLFDWDVTLVHTLYTECWERCAEIYSTKSGINEWEQVPHLYHREVMVLWLLFVIVGVSVIPPSHCLIVEAFHFLSVIFNIVFFFSLHPFRALDTDLWQISEIIIIILFSGNLSFAWQNVKSIEFQFCIVLR